MVVMMMVVVVVVVVVVVLVVVLLLLMMMMMVMMMMRITVIPNRFLIDNSLVYIVQFDTSRYRSSQCCKISEYACM